MAFTGGIFIGLYKFKPISTKEREPPKEQPRPQQQREVKRLKKQLQNFMLYDGTPQDDIHIE